MSAAATTSAATTVPVVLQTAKATGCASAMEQSETASRTTRDVPNARPSCLSFSFSGRGPLSDLPRMNHPRFVAPDVRGNPPLNVQGGLFYSAWGPWGRAGPKRLLRP